MDEIIKSEKEEEEGGIISQERWKQLKYLNQIIFCYCKLIICLTVLCSKQRAMFCMAVCYSANVGGTGTVIGSTPNLLFIEYLEVTFNCHFNLHK